MTTAKKVKIEKIGRKLFVDLLPFLLAGDGLVKAQINFIIFPGFAVRDFVHDFTERREVLLNCLIYENIPIRQK